MEMPAPDTEAMRWGQQLEAALIIAATSHGNAAPAVQIADEMIARGVVTTETRAGVLAMGLLGLTVQHETAQPGTPDPYRALAARLRDDGVLTDLDLDTARQAWVLNHGLSTGWLPAAAYDRLASFGGDDPQFLSSLSRIERRATTPRRDPGGPDA